MNQEPPFAQLFSIRTVTYFVSAQPTSLEGWRHEIASAAAFLHAAKSAYTTLGYTVQTLRIATRALQGAATCEQAFDLAVNLEALAVEHGIGFLSLGSTSDAAWLTPGGAGPGGATARVDAAPPAVAILAEALRFTSFTVAWQRGWGLPEARALAQAIHAIAQRSSNANFRFGVGFNCQPGIPFFPAATAGEGSGFAIGTENSSLLDGAFRSAAERTDGNNGSVLDAAQACLASVMIAALQPVEAAAKRLAESRGVPYLGIDASIAPALRPPDIASAFELLRLGPFGGGGTLAVAERVTAALKSLPLKLCGYCGLMLPVCEDVGLAAAAASGALTTQGLLHFSAVCGVGLDTVPVPGPSADTAPDEVERLTAACAAVLLDTAAMAFRLDKPLSVRLLPVPGAAVGNPVAFNNPYLVDSAVMRL